MINTHVLARIKRTLQAEYKKAGSAEVANDIQEEIQTITETINLIHALQDKDRADAIINVILGLE